MIKKRDGAIDIVRSIAIALMVSANMAVISNTEPFWIFRFTSSLAAPIFIILTTMMAILGLTRGKGMGSALTKCLFLFGTAALLDISHSLIPIQNIDVLYLIGILLVIVSLLGRFSNVVLLSLAGLILIATPYLQAKFGYQVSMPLMLNDINFKTNMINFFYELTHRYLIDGWFPLFPWLSVGLFGAVLGKLRYRAEGIVSFAKYSYAITSLLLISLGIVLWLLFPGDQIIRYNYIELFYQPVPGFMIVVMGVALAIICLMDYIGDVSLWSLLHPLGEASLFMYFFHILIIEYILVPQGHISFGLRYVISYFILISIMIGLGLLLRRIRAKAFYRSSPHVVKWIFG